MQFSFIKLHFWHAHVGRAASRQTGGGRVKKKKGAKNTHGIQPMLFFKSSPSEMRIILRISHLLFVCFSAHVIQVNGLNEIRDHTQLTIGIRICGCEFRAIIALGIWRWRLLYFGGIWKRRDKRMHGTNIVFSTKYSESFEKSQIAMRSIVLV